MYYLNRLWAAGFCLRLLHTIHHFHEPRVSLDPRHLMKQRTLRSCFEQLVMDNLKKQQQKIMFYLIMVHLTLQKVFFNGTEKFILLFPLKCDFLWISLNSLCPGWIQAPKAIWDLGIESMRCNVGTRKTLKRNYVSPL